MNASEPRRDSGAPDSGGDARVPPFGRRPIAVGATWFPKGAACRDCHSEIGFRLTAKGLWQPINKDLVPHGATCSAKRKARRTTCPACQSVMFETIYTDIPLPHYAKAKCLDCGQSWWLGRPGAKP